MDREQALKILKHIANLSLYYELELDEEVFEAVSVAITALEQTALLEQIRWERDVAISQLHELGYEFGEKIEQKPTDGVQRTSNANKKHVENTLEDAISRTRLKEVFHRNVVCGEAYDELIDAQPPVTVQEKTDSYKQGWHDAIDKALNEAYTIHHYGDIFRVVQEETLIGLGTAYEQVGTEKTGRWIYDKQRSDWNYASYYCSCCGRNASVPDEMVVSEEFPYCSNCGAKMGVEE